MSFHITVLETFLKYNNLLFSTDGSTSRGNRHYLAVLLQTMEKLRVVTYFYHLIEIPLDETSVGLTTVLVNQLKTDKLYETIKNNIVGFVSDGASVMVGVKSGMDKILRYVIMYFTALYWL